MLSRYQNMTTSRPFSRRSELRTTCRDSTVHSKGSCAAGEAQNSALASSIPLFDADSSQAAEPHLMCSCNPQIHACVCSGKACSCKVLRCVMDQSTPVLLCGPCFTQQHVSC